MMSMIKTRIAKLEETSQEASPASRPPGIPAEAMREARRVAAVCSSWEDLAAYLRSQLVLEDQDVVSFEERRRVDAVLNASARTIFEESREVT
jgi:hypothetical protein